MNSVCRSGATAYGSSCHGYDQRWCAGCMGNYGEEGSMMMSYVDPSALPSRGDTP